MIQDKDADKIELRSEEFQDILGTVPHWILRWGITAFAIIVIILLIGSAIFKYPDIISSSITLTGSIPPAAIVAKSSGKLKELYVDDNQTVKEGQYLAVVENSTETKDILLLRGYLDKINLNTDTIITLLPEHLQLGTLQSNYSAFYLTLFEYSEYKRLKYYSTKAGIINGRINQYETQLANLIRQKKITEEQLSLTKNKYQRDSLLNRKGILSNEEYENTKNQYLQGILSCENIASSVDNSRIQIGQMKENLFETNYQDIEKGNTLKSKLGTLITQLQSEIQDWELTYVLSSPVNGKITFTNYWAINQNVTTGEDIFNIIPTDSVKLLGKASLPTTRSGKVETEQKVNIRFENFPDNEYGIIKGIVRNISLVPVKGKETTNYTVEIELPNGLQTTYGKELPYLPEMTGQADIITKDISVLERFIMPLRKAISEGLE
ncbi:MAG: HlyD family secretion protein [Tannerellaceae bacterium]|jgi:HlyD family secretion protein|nr:HlyD family secretion protein [Tannerellaceae bacterium]